MRAMKEELKNIRAKLYIPQLSDHGRAGFER
jgi:hypothetical protein